jgi:hypothetical protein
VKTFPERMSDYTVIRYEPFPGLRLVTASNATVTGKTQLADGSTVLKFAQPGDNARFLKTTTIEIEFIKALGGLVSRDVFESLCRIACNRNLPLELRVEAALQLELLAGYARGEFRREFRMVESGDLSGNFAVRTNADGVITYSIEPRLLSRETASRLVEMLESLVEMLERPATAASPDSNRFGLEEYANYQAGGFSNLLSRLIEQLSNLAKP